MSRFVWKMIDFLREFIIWQIFFLLGVGMAISSFQKFLLEGSSEAMLHSYLGGAFIIFSLWLRKKELTDGKRFTGIPRWLDWCVAGINFPLGIIWIQRGDYGKGVVLLIASIVIFITSFFRSGEDGGGGDDKPKDDEPKPPGKSKPLDWVFKRPKSPVNVLNN